jgi:hypothetical protein
MSLLEFLQWLEQTGVGTFVRESTWGFPLLVGTHLLTMTLSVGTLVWFDLRLLGVGIRHCSVSRLYRLLMPWMITGFLVMVVSGGMLLAGFATLAYQNGYFRIKAAALAVAGTNMLVYHLSTEKTIAQWDDVRVPPVAARMAGLISIIAWIVVILAGRMMAYTMYDPVF